MLLEELIELADEELLNHIDLIKDFEPNEKDELIDDGRDQ